MRIVGAGFIFCQINPDERFVSFVINKPEGIISTATDLSTNKQLDVNSEKAQEMFEKVFSPLHKGEAMSFAIPRFEIGNRILSISHPDIDDNYVMFKAFVEWLNE